MTELSPAAQVAIVAWWNASDGEYINGVWTPNRSAQLAAALEAAADRVVPFAEITPQKNLEGRRDAMVWGMQHQTQLTRQQLLTIAAELRGDIATTQENN